MGHLEIHCLKSDHHNPETMVRQFLLSEAVLMHCCFIKCLRFVVHSEVTGMERSLTGFWTGCKISDCTVERSPRELPKLMIFVVTSVGNEDVLQF